MAEPDVPEAAVAEPSYCLREQVEATSACCLAVMVGGPFCQRPGAPAPKYCLREQVEAACCVTVLAEGAFGGAPGRRLLRIVHRS